MADRRDWGGFSLIEMLVATSVFAFGMGGMASLMLAASGGMSEAGHETIAHLGADAMAATLQLAPAALDHLANPPQTVPLCMENESCTSEEWLAAQYLIWRARMARELPGGAGIVCRDSTPMDGGPEAPACDGGGPAVVKVLWRAPRHAHDRDQGVRRAVSQVPR